MADYGSIPLAKDLAGEGPKAPRANRLDSVLKRTVTMNATLQDQLVGLRVLLDSILGPEKTVDEDAGTTPAPENLIDSILNEQNETLRLLDLLVREITRLREF